MKNRIIISLVLIVPLIIYFLLLAFNPEVSIEESANAMTDTPQVIVFSTPMCGECKRMSPVVEKVKTNYDGKVEVIKINATESKHSNLVRKHGIYLVPTTIFLDKDGKVIQRVEGAMTYNEFETFVNILLK